MPQKTPSNFRLFALLIAIHCAGIAASLFAADAPAPETKATASTAPTEAAANSPTQVPSSVEKTPADTGDATASALPADPGATASAVPLVTESASQPGRIPPSQNVTINLINRLVQRGVLSKEDASELIKQAEADAATARAQAEADAGAAAQAAVAQVAASQLPPPPSDDSVRVTYVPEIVKQEMRDQIKQEVMDQAREENWANPRTLPEWTTRIKLFGDVRFRYEGDFYPADNSIGAGSDYWNFNSINTSTPYDYTSTTINPPYANKNQDRNRFRLRVRLGVETDLGQGFTAGIRLGTGDSNSPVSGNQSLGAANSAQGGNFSKYQIWLDRAFIKYDQGGQPDRDFSVTLGRFDNPFFSTSMIWADDLGFDGAVVQGKYQVAEGVTPFAVVGAFPVFNTDLNFATNNASKYASSDKWLYAAQIGTDWKITKDLDFKVAAALYYFQNVEGKVSSPFIPLSSQDAGNTDDSRPGFAQSGNTYIALRDIVPDPVLNNNGTTNQWQYFGLATPFHELAVTARLDYNHFEPVQISLISELVDNLAFNRSAIENNGPPQLRGPVNNNNSTTGAFEGGDKAWNISLRAGSAALEKFGDWNVGLGYRYVESDAVVDGFCDSDFGGGGTNLKGYTIYGRLALTPRVWLGLRWMSADSIAGPTYKDDVVQFEVNAKF